MSTLVSEVRARVQQSTTPLVMPLIDTLTAPTHLSSAGFPYISAESFAHFRDHVPHILGNAPRVWKATLEIHSICREIHGTSPDEQAFESMTRAKSVIRTILNTASVTAPPDLWIARHLMSTYKALGLLDRFLAGEIIDPACCEFQLEQRTVVANPHEFQIDLEFLVARGYLDMDRTRFWLTDVPWAHETLRQALPQRPDQDIDTVQVWARMLAGKPFTIKERSTLLDLNDGRYDTPPHHRPTWVATWNEIELAYRLLPLVLALNIVGWNQRLTAGEAFVLGTDNEVDADIFKAAANILIDAGVLKAESRELTDTGHRVCTRAAGPCGIIATYKPYLDKCRDIVLEGRGQVWVERGANVAASQDANRRTFEKANDSLDRFCADTGFQYTVFIEHAVGRGEATRQRWERSGEETIRYFGADLEDDAIDAAMKIQREGRLPSNMVFIRRADIGNPEYLIGKLAEHKLSTHGVVMLVGNGFHEVRHQTDEAMIALFRTYGEAGLILLFTEENALSVDDLRATAWNTYHAGFKFVHEKSGQGLRPAYPREPPRFGRPLPASWNECATKAGYIRLESYCSRTRTIFPYRQKGQHNPSISVNHFFIPKALAEDLGLSAPSSP
jgi:hypothetical protein